MGRPQFAELSDRLLTGVEPIDRQHRILINILNELAADDSGRSDRDSFERATRDLLGYVIFHFESEERLIKESGYDVAEPANATMHIRQHRAFADRLLALRAEPVAATMHMQADLLQFLRDWLVNHIGTTDQLLGRYIRGQSSRASAV